jgi:hypothetical protein
MTNPIKPPGSGGPRAISPSAPRDGADVQRTAPSQAPAASASASGARGADAALVEQLRRGELTASQVVDAVVTRALDQARAQGLPASERRNLEDMLRKALANDPTLSGLTRELER